MSNPQSNLLFQSEAHPLVADTYETLEQYCLGLIHQRAYEEVSWMVCGRTVLDIGCNHGYGTALLSQRACSVIGIDVSPTAIASARQRHPEMTFQQVDGGALPFPDGSFEVVTAFQVIEHVELTSPFLAEVRRVLKPGGIAVFTTPNAAIRLDSGMKPWNPFHVREYLCHDLRRELSGPFRNVHLRGLFAAPELYSIERGRSERAKRRARNLSPLQDPALLAAYVRSGSLGVLRRLLPGESYQKLSTARQRRFHTGMLYYSQQDLERALDFMAVCWS